MSRSFLQAAALTLLLLSSPALAAEKPADKDAAPAAAEVKAAPDATATDAAKTPAAATDAAATTTPAAASPATPAVLAKKWEVNTDKSQIAFHGKQMGSDFDGVFQKFNPEIYFDADHLDQSKATVTFDITGIDAKDADRNKNVQGADWFNAAKFPTARFETTKFTKTGDNAFTADANLTIRGITVPVQLPFTLDTKGSGSDSGKDRVVMTGKVTLDRSKFQLGQGDWADPTVIANEVPVDIKITATAEAAPKTPDKPAKP